jgi:hypothetical protein
MIAPNLASQPHLNTRPVWVVTAVAAALALIFAATNLQVWLSSSHDLEEQLVRQKKLEAEYRRLTTEVGAQVEDLNRVPWRSLAGRVNAVNSVIRSTSSRGSSCSTTSRGPCPTTFG